MLWMFLACWTAKIEALESEVEDLQDQVDELDESPDDSAPLDADVRAPSAYFSYNSTGSSGSYQLNVGAVVEGDYDYARIQVWSEAGFEEVEEGCLQLKEDVSSTSIELAIEAWWDGNYSCWAFATYSSQVLPCPLAIRVDEVTCD